MKEGGQKILVAYLDATGLVKAKHFLKLSCVYEQIFPKSILLHLLYCEQLNVVATLKHNAYA